MTPSSAFPEIYACTRVQLYLQLITTSNYFKAASGFMPNGVDDPTVVSVFRTFELRGTWQWYRRTLRIPFCPMVAHLDCPPRVGKLLVRTVLMYTYLVHIAVVCAGSAEHMHMWDGSICFTCWLPWSST